jgi:hypothetical protein
MKALLVDASQPRPTKAKRKGWYYNLGIAKAANWWKAQGAEVATIAPPLTIFDDIAVDVAMVSAIFSWHVRDALTVAKSLRRRGIAVEVGGPGFFALRHVALMEGFTAQISPDPRFDRMPGTYDAVFWSRGCPAYNCSLGYPKDGSKPICLVPEMEGSRFTLIEEANPARLILDNNLSALPLAYQRMIVERTLAAGFDWVDCNSGFEPASFKPETAALWNRLPLKAWRYAYDEIGERKAVLKVIGILDALGIARRKSHIYCIAGNEPLEECEQRVKEIREWGCVPVVQRRRPLDYMGGPLPCVHGWSERKLIDFQRWGNRLSHSIDFGGYDRTVKGVKMKRQARAEKGGDHAG